MTDAPKLTARQREILKLHCATEALTAEAIASRLGVSPSTVRGHIADLHAILEVSCRLQLFIKAVHLGLISVDDENA